MRVRLDIHGRPKSSAASLENDTNKEQVDLQHHDTSQTHNEQSIAVTPQSPKTQLPPIPIITQSSISDASIPSSSQPQNETISQQSSQLPLTEQNYSIPKQSLSETSTPTSENATDVTPTVTSQSSITDNQLSRSHSQSLSSAHASSSSRRAVRISLPTDTHSTASASNSTHQPTFSSTKIATRVPTPLPTDDERETDIPEPTGSESGSTDSTEAYNSEDEHADAKATAAATQPEIPMRTLRERENEFVDMLSSKGLRIIEMRADGNCLFRALAHCVWGDAERHPSLRASVMQYLVQERDYFSHFVAEDFRRYVCRKRREGVHGNHLELQAAAELFGRPIEVYSYSATPTAIIDSWGTPPAARDAEPIRLSFHSGSHYNAVQPLAGPHNKAEQKQAAADADAAAAAVAALDEAQWRAAADARATEDEMERAVMALSLIEATRGDSAPGSSSSAAAAVPSSVLALVNSGYSEEQAMEAYRIAGDGGLADMIRFLTTEFFQVRPTRNDCPSFRSSSSSQSFRRRPRAIDQHAFGEFRETAGPATEQFANDGKSEDTSSENVCEGRDLQPADSQQNQPSSSMEDI